MKRVIGLETVKAVEPIIVINFRVFDEDKPLEIGLNPVCKDWNFATKEDAGIDVSNLIKFCSNAVGSDYSSSMHIDKSIPSNMGASIRNALNKALDNAYTMLRKKPEVSQALSNGRVTIIFNTNGYETLWRVSQYIYNGIKSFMTEHPKLNNSSTRLLILVRKASAFVDTGISDYWIDYISSEDMQFHVSLIGLEDCVLYQDESIVTNLPDNNGQPLDFNLFSEVLNPSESTVRTELRRNTNINIGHFVLKNSHVRTHYRLESFLDRDFVRAFLYKRILKAINPNLQYAFVFTGLQADVLVKSIETFATSLNWPSRESLFCYNPSNPLKEYEIDTIAKHDAILIITDITNTGDTLDSAAKYLRRLFTEKAINVFSIIKMENTSDALAESGLTLHYMVEIGRKYYEPDSSSCILCRSTQAATTVSSLSDFEIVDKEQPTPYDFWEMVKECRALSSEKIGPHFRINTGDISRNYRRWLIVLLKRKLMANGFSESSGIEMIVTVNEKESIAFAHIVYEALNEIPTAHTLTDKSILIVEKENIEDVYEYVAKPQDPRHDIGTIFVDDGINSGNTIKNLARYFSRKYENGDIIYRAMGAIVLDCRLDAQTLERISEEEKFSFGITPLYTWTGSVI